MLFQIRFDATLEHRGGVRASFVRQYGCPDLAATSHYSFDVVTPKLLQGRRLNHVLLSTVDDWIVLFSRDHTVRLASLQRSVMRIELEMTGIESGSYPVRGTMSPDGKFVICGSETGTLHVWSAEDGTLLTLDTGMPQVQLAGPVMDVAWSEHYHVLACCAVDDQAPPVLVFVGGDPDRPRPAEQKQDHGRHQPLQGQRELPIRFPALQDAPVDEMSMMPMSIAPPVGQEWRDRWLNSNENPRSAISFEDKRRMKEMILATEAERRGLTRSLLGQRGDASDVLPGSA